MPSRNYTSTAKPRALINTVTAAATTITMGPAVDGEDVWPAAPFLIALDRGNQPLRELCLVTAVAANGANFDLTVVRGYNGTVAKAHNAGVTVEHTTGAIDHSEAVSNQGGSVIATSAPALKGLVVQGAASQSANLQEWQNSSGTVLTKIDAAGIGWLTRSVVGASTNANTIALQVLGSDSSTNATATVRGGASQTGNLQEWQNSAGTGVAAINSGGALWVGNSTGGSPVAGAYALINGSGNALQLCVRGAASQSINLQEWQNSSGAVQANITPTGLGNFAALNTGDHTNPNGSIAVGSSTPFAYGARLEVTATSAGHRGIVVRGAASQSANLQEWQNSSGTALFAIQPTGRMTYPSGEMTATTATGGSASLPSQPAGFITINTSGGGTAKIPYYNN
jgi:hypothetical protein